VGLLRWLTGDDRTHDRFFPGDGTIVNPVVAPYSPDIGELINAYVAEREAWGLYGDPKGQPVVERGVELIASAVAQLSPVEYVNGRPSDELPPIVDKPDPWSTRYAFLFATVRSMIEAAGAGWYLYDADPDTGRPRAAYVIDPAELTVSYDDKHFQRVYRWRGRDMRPGVDFVYIPLAPRAGQAAGVSPLLTANRALWAIEAAELYAAGFFGGAGVPSGVITTPSTLDKGEADRLKAEWMAAHAGPVSTPAVLSGGITYTPVALDPERSQLAQTRDAGVATVARILGIPAPLLIVNADGSSITYANVSQLYQELMRATVVPLYLLPIEAAFSSLVPSDASVRFDLAELQRLDVAARWSVYEAASRIGVLDAAAIARLEGYGAPTAPAMAPSPALVESRTPEVPA
jgi:HK97 family phage portal protein